MHAGIFLCAAGDRLALATADLARAFDDAGLEQAGEEVTFALFPAGDGAGLSRRLEKFMTASRGAASIVVSDLLVDRSPGGHVASALACAIEEKARDLDACNGLIGLVAGETGRVRGIDALVRIDPLDAKELRTKLLAVAHRLWWKAPPARKAAVQEGERVLVRSVETRAELRACLALRGGVYRSLGYLEDDILRADSEIELDGYDAQARHFAAFDPAQMNRVVGTMRLIVPGLDPRLPAVQQADCARDYQDFCRKIADRERHRAFRDRLNMPAPTALPIFDSFDYFENKECFLSLKDEIELSSYAEISRVVVAPDWRGRGVSRKLVEHAIGVAQRLGRRCLLLECAPHHQHMYEKYGFTVLESGGQRFYARAQLLDQIAVAMRRDLVTASGAARSRRPGAAIGRCRLRVDEGVRAGYSLLIESSRLSSAELDLLMEQPPPALSLGAFGRNPHVADLLPRGEAPYRALLLASIAAGEEEELLARLQPLLQRDGSLIVTLEDPRGARVPLPGADPPPGPFPPSTPWSRRQERTHG
jgi:predicted GNAT family N-acyltransferase